MVRRTGLVALLSLVPTMAVCADTFSTTRQRATETSEGVSWTVPERAVRPSQLRPSGRIRTLARDPAAAAVIVVRGGAADVAAWPGRDGVAYDLDPAGGRTLVCMPGTPEALAEALYLPPSY
jgi:hypothetical protein